MECPICSDNAESMPATGDFTSYRCSSCGPFGISGSLFRMLRKASFDVDRTRERIKEARSEYDCPMLSTCDEDLLIFSL